MPRVGWISMIVEEKNDKMITFIPEQDSRFFPKQSVKNENIHKKGKPLIPVILSAFLGFLDDVIIFEHECPCIPAKEV